MSIFKNRIQEQINSYLDIPKYDINDKRWHIKYVDLNTNTKYDIRFLSQSEAYKYYQKRYSYLYNFLTNLILQYNKSR